MYQRFSRHIVLPEIGVSGQEKLLNASVLIVGVGGLGSPVALYLASCGVGRLGIIDHDVVSLSNLQRQILYKECEVGLKKSCCASIRLQEISSQVIIEQYNEVLSKENACHLVAQYDLVVDCSDNAATRYLIDETCAQQTKPFVYGAIGAYSGQVSVFDARENWRYIDLFPDRLATSKTSPATQGVIGSLPGIIGSIQATEVIKIITQLGEPLVKKLFTLDIRTMESHTFNFL